jgi:hypothetical protein
VLKKNAKGVVAEEDGHPSRMIASLKQIQSHINTNKHLRSHTWHEALLNLKFSIYEGFDIRVLSKKTWLQRKEEKVHQSTMNGKQKNGFSTEIHLPKTHQQANDTTEMSVKSNQPHLQIMNALLPIFLKEWN